MGSGGRHTPVGAGPHGTAGGGGRCLTGRHRRPPVARPKCWAAARPSARDPAVSACTRPGAGFGAPHDCVFHVGRFMGERRPARTVFAAPVAVCAPRHSARAPLTGEVRIPLTGVVVGSRSCGHGSTDCALWTWDPGITRDRLNTLVLSGAKRAAAGLLEADYRAEGEEPESVGERLVLIRSDGERVTEVDVDSVEIVPFRDVSWSSPGPRAKAARTSGTGAGPRRILEERGPDGHRRHGRRLRTVHARAGGALSGRSTRPTGRGVGRDARRPYWGCSRSHRLP